jgi:endonuclease/exonuclease/phosphatase family metal-dependent hydrolase
MRFLTFNLWHGLSPSSPVTMEALEPAGRKVLRERLQLEVIRQTGADIQFFQEVNPVARRAQALADAAEAEYASQGDLTGVKLFGLGLPYNLNSGLVTTVGRKWGIKPLGAVSLSRPGTQLVRPWGSWQLKEERFALFAETLLPGWGKVLLVNAHIHHGLESTDKLANELLELAEELELSASAVSELKERLAKGNAKREAEVAELFRAVDERSGRFEAVVIAGDLNARPENQISVQFAKLGFRDAWKEANPDDPGLTYDATRNEANHLLQKNFPLTLMVEDLSFSAKIKDSLLAMARRHEMLPRRIDYIYFRAKSVKLKCKSARLIGVPGPQELAPSDHFGVLAEIEAE